MADYPGATRPFPELTEIGNEFSDQSASEGFRDATLAFCHTINVSIDEIVGVTLGYLQRCNPIGIEDLAEFMRQLITIYGLTEYQPDSTALYEAVKGIPAHSRGRIGYTFQRRRQGADRGVFLFLR
jgi:hypothetical protein